MVNQVEVAEIPLVGPGFCHRPVGNYGPGEFKRLVNMELTDQGTLRKRPPVEQAGHYFVESAGDFVGHLQDYAAVRKNGWSDVDSPDDTMHFIRKYAQHTNTNVVWNGLNLYASGFDPTEDGHAVVGFVRFNNSNLWYSMSQYYDFGAQTYTTKFWQHRYSNASKNISVYPTVFSTSVPDVHTLLFQEVVPTYGLSGTQPMNFIKMFQFKQRLWIVTNRGIYGSKIGDYANFTAPDGYFLKFPDDYLKDAVPSYDRIYVLGNDNLSHFTYGDDINTSAVSTTIAQGLGGDALVIHEDSVYMARRDQLYLVETTRVSKVFDLNLGIPNTYPSVQLTSYFDYIILCYRYKGDSLPNITQVDPALGDAGQTWDSTVGAFRPNEWSVNTYWLNMKTGAVMEFLYHNEPKSHPAILYWETYTDAVGHPISFYSMPFEDTESHDYYLLFLCSGSNTMGGRVYSIRQSLQDDIDDYTNSAIDFAWKPASYPPPGAGDAYFYWTNIPIMIEFDSIMPDGSEMWMKKFRSLVIEGQIPTSLFNEVPGSWLNEYMTVEFAYGEQNYGTPIDISSTLGITSINGVGIPGNPITRFPVPYRIGMNQRGRSVSTKIKQGRFFLDLEVKPSSQANPQRVEIVRMSMLWTPTGRNAIRSKGDISA